MTTTINQIEISNFDDTTIKVIAGAKDIEESFYVQTVDSKHRTDLGCWILSNTISGDVSQDDFPDFDFDKIIDAAETFIKLNTEQLLTDFEIDNQQIYLIKKNNSVDLVTRNDNYINKFQSAYMRQFSDPIKTFESKEDAIEYLEQLNK